MTLVKRDEFVIVGIGGFLTDGLVTERQSHVSFYKVGVWVKISCRDKYTKFR